MLFWSLLSHSIDTQPPTPRLRIGVEGVDYSGRNATVTTSPTSKPTKFPQWDQSLELQLSPSDISSSRPVSFTIEDRLVAMTHTNMLTWVFISMQQIKAGACALWSAGGIYEAIFSILYRARAHGRVRLICPRSAAPYSHSHGRLHRCNIT